MGRRIFVCPECGDPLHDEKDATGLIGEAVSTGATMVVIPVERLHEDLFQLRTGVAGAIIQKFAIYRVPVTIVGDIARWTEQSLAFRDFVYEANRGGDLWFVAAFANLIERLNSART